MQETLDHREHLVIEDQQDRQGQLVSKVAPEYRVRRALVGQLDRRAFEVMLGHQDHPDYLDLLDQPAVLGREENLDCQDLRVQLGQADRKVYTIAYLILANH